MRSAMGQNKTTQNKTTMRTRDSASPSAAAGLKSGHRLQIASTERLHTDDVVHQSLGDRLLHGRHSELALGVLGVKDHRPSADAYNFRGIQSALSASCPLQAGPLALSQAWAKR